MGIGSSWNCDRIAANCTCARSRRIARRYVKKSQPKIMKVSDQYIQEYGEAAYQAWKRREEEIDSMMDSIHYSRAEIAQLRKENFRRMKEGPTA